MGEDRTEGEPLGFPVEIDPSPSTVLRLEDDERVFAEAEGYRVVQWRNVLLTHWRAPVSMEGLDACDEASFDLAERYAKVMVLNVIQYGLEIPPSEVRKRATAVLAKTADHVAAVATVLPGEGFWASAARAAVATMTLLSRARHPHKVFGTTDEAARFVHPHVLPEHTPLFHLQKALGRLTRR